MSGYGIICFINRKWDVLIDKLSKRIMIDANSVIRESSKLMHEMVDPAGCATPEWVMAGRDRFSTLGRVWTLAAAFVLGPAGPGHADLVHPVPFDATITVDTETGLEWLDLTETVGLSYAQVEAGAGGFVADGWRHATVHEVCDLFERYLVPTNPPPRSCPATQFDFPTRVTFSSQVMFIAYLGSTNFSYGGGGGGLAGLTDGSIPPRFRRRHVRSSRLLQRKRRDVVHRQHHESDRRALPGEDAVAGCSRAPRARRRAAVFAARVDRCARDPCPRPEAARGASRVTHAAAVLDLEGQGVDAADQPRHRRQAFTDRRFKRAASVR